MKRRQKGEGSIYQRADKYWVAKVVVDGKSLTKTVKTSDEAVEALKILNKEKSNFVERPDSQKPLIQHLSVFMKSVFRKNNRDNSYERSLSVAVLHILPKLGEKPVGEITKADCQDLYNEMAQKGLSGSSIHKAHVLLGQCFRSLIPDVISYDPTANTVRPSVRPKKKKLLLTDKQAEKLLEVIDKSTSLYKDFVYVLWEMGGRTSEVIGLKWDCVFENFIRVESVTVKVKAGIKNEAPKKEKSERDVYLSKETMDIIRKQKKMGEYVFVNSAGKQIGARNWRRQWDQWLITAFGAEPLTKEERKAGKPRVPILKITPHSMRHYQATRLIEAGCSVADVQQRLGMTEKILMEIYSKHTSIDRQKKMAKKAVVKKLQATK